MSYEPPNIPLGRRCRFGGISPSPSISLSRAANAKPINPTTTKTAPATINQCAYCIAEPPSRSSFLHLQPDLDQAADGFGNGRCRSRTLTVSQLSRQAKENPVRGAGFERGKFSGAH